MASGLRQLPQPDHRHVAEHGVQRHGRGILWVVQAAGVGEHGGKAVLGCQVGVALTLEVGDGERHRNSADAQQRQVKHQPFIAVAGPDADPRAGGQAALGELPGQPGDIREHLGPGPVARLTMDHHVHPARPAAAQPVQHGHRLGVGRASGQRGTRFPGVPRLPVADRAHRLNSVSAADPDCAVSTVLRREKPMPAQASTPTPRQPSQSAVLL